MSQTLEQLREEYELSIRDGLVTDIAGLTFDGKNAAHSAYIAAVIKAERAKIWAEVDQFIPHYMARVNIRRIIEGETE